MVIESDRIAEQTTKKKYNKREKFVPDWWRWAAEEVCYGTGRGVRNEKGKSKIVSFGNTRGRGKER